MLKTRAIWIKARSWKYQVLHRHVIIGIASTHFGKLTREIIVQQYVVEGVNYF